MNESKNLPLLLADISEINEEAEILIIDSQSEDKTKDIALIYSTKFYKLNIRNRGCQLNYGAKRSNSNWLLFIHADSRLKPNWSKEVKSIIQSNSEKIFFFNFKINNKKFVYRVIEFFVNIRCLLFKSPYGDQGLLIKKSRFIKLHGFKEIPIMEDFDFINRLPDKKCLSEIKTSIFTSSRKWEKVNFITQSIKNWELRRRWVKGENIESIYSDYYKT